MGIKKNLKPSQGFTLVEIIVATSIFTVVMLITIGALLSLNDASRKAQALRTVIDNLNFAIEDLNRKIRTGDSYRCYLDGVVVNTIPPNSPSDISDCAGEAGKAISLKTQELDGPALDPANVWAAYIFRPADALGGGRIVQRRSIAGQGGPVLDPTEYVITSPEVDIKTMEFRVVGADDDKKQPMILLNISGVVDLKKEKLRTDFSLQTAVSRRGTE